jgi:hypothetical protein
MGTCHGSDDGRRQLNAEERLQSQAQSMRDLRWKKVAPGQVFPSVSFYQRSLILYSPLTDVMQSARLKATMGVM